MGNMAHCETDSLHAPASAATLGVLQLHYWSFARVRYRCSHKQRGIHVLLGGNLSCVRCNIDLYAQRISVQNLERFLPICKSQSF